MLHRKTIFLLSIYTMFYFISCTGNADKKPSEGKKDTLAVKKDIKTRIKPDSKIKKPPIINIVDTVAPKRIIVYVKDSAATFERISIKLGQIYGLRLAEFFKKNPLKITGQPMAWYVTQKAPYFFEAGIPVNKRPGKLTKGFKVRELAADSVVIAHFYGPYDLLYMGYDALKDWMKDHKRRSSAAPYEMYVSDPLDKKGRPVDPYKIQTDIVFPRR